MLRDLKVEVTALDNNKSYNMFKSAEVSYLYLIVFLGVG